MKWTTVIVLTILVVLCTPAAASKVDFVIGESDVLITPTDPTSVDEITVEVTVHNNGLKASKQNKVKLLLKLGKKKILKPNRRKKKLMFLPNRFSQ